ncbi:hypothetical protein HKCCE4037_05005 [Rhodobacterales bacterium HKCCE4037]|nr:hypothetical protein [Rhodobacterales bacterium HKCCE4037]
MALADSTFTEPKSSLRARLDTFFAALGQGFNAYLERETRFDQIRQLDAKTDAELAEMGLKRDDIPRYVYRDLFYI